MEGEFRGRLINLGNVELDATGDAPILIIDERPVSLHAIRAVSPSMVAVLEVLARPESDGGVFRLERDGAELRLTKTGVLAHFAAKIAAQLQRRRIRA
jgi:hypothetical protein